MSNNGRYKKRGWFGDSQRHALAAKGISTSYYSQKQKLVDPKFFTKREEKVPSSHIREMIQNGNTLSQMQQMHPDADPADLRLRAIKMVDSLEGNNTMTMLNKTGVEMVDRLVSTDDKNGGRLRRSVMDVLNDSQKSSFLPAPKVQALKSRLAKSRGPDRGSDAGLTDPSYFEGGVPY